MMKVVKQFLRVKNIPTSTEVNELLKKCKVIMKKKEDQCGPLNSIKDDFDGFKTKRIRLKNDALDSEDWDKKTENDKREAYLELVKIFQHLIVLNKNELRIGITTFFILLVLIFVGSIGAYLYLHIDSSRNDASSKKRINIESVFEIEKELSIIQSLVGQLDKEETKKKFERSFFKITEHLINEPLRSKITFDLKKNFGMLAGEKEMGNVKLETFKGFRKILEAEIESINTKFFWLGTPGKWYEIAFWSFWGVIVGILFYIAGLIDSGIFLTEQIPMFLTEIVITPIVVIAIFFLFALTRLSNFIPSESSIYTILGISFILGFAIRRTVGLLDNIKKKIFPEPAPAGKR